MRDQVVGLLLLHAEREGVPIYWSHSLRAVDFAARSVTVARDVEEGPPVTVAVADTLIGADGNFSRVRRECEEPLEMQEHSQ